MSSQSAAINFSSAPQRSLTVSVIVPVYNAERWLASTLISVLQQDYEAFEVIAVDDGSHDQSVAILTRFAQQDQRVRVVQQLHQGVAAARNRAIALATGDLIAPIDADDLWHPQFLAQHVQRHSHDPQIAVSYCWSLDVNQQDRWSGRFHAARIDGWVHNTLLCHNFLGNGSCSVIRRAALQPIGGYQSQLEPCEDWDLYLRLAEHYPFGVVPQFYVGDRQHPDSASKKVDRMAHSHQTMLIDRRQQFPYLRPWVWDLSRRRWLKYLRHQLVDLGPITPTRPFPLATPMRQRDRLRIRIKVMQVGILHWLMRNFGQRRNHQHPQPAPPTM
jgi:glycosyltransferase involved in cell wall biosynthesis